MTIVILDFWFYSELAIVMKTPIKSKNKICKESQIFGKIINQESQKLWIHCKKVSVLLYSRKYQHDI